MKFLIASDIHGSAYYCKKLMELIETEAPDTILLLGDLLYHGPRNALPRDYDPMQVAAMLGNYADKILAVRGNCDAEVDQMVLPFPCAFIGFPLTGIGTTLLKAAHLGTIQNYVANETAPTTAARPPESSSRRGPTGSR